MRHKKICTKDNLKKKLKIFKSDFQRKYMYMIYNQKRIKKLSIIFFQ